MSYKNPTPRDVEKLIRFNANLNESLTSTVRNEPTPKEDLLRTAINRYTNPTVYVDNAARPPHGVSEERYQNATRKEQLELVATAAKEHIQEKMDDAVVLSQLHDTHLENIAGLDQSPAASRELTASNANQSTTKVTLSQF